MHRERWRNGKRRGLNSLARKRMGVRLSPAYLRGCFKSGNAGPSIGCRKVAKGRQRASTVVYGPATISDECSTWLLKQPLRSAKPSFVNDERQRYMYLIHPIYLDVPMLVSFAAAIQGGLSLESEVTREKEANKSGSAKVAGKFGLSNLFSNLFDVAAEADISGSAAGRNQETRHELKSHTEASIAILLYDELRRDKRYLTQPQDATVLSKVNPGTLVEVAGILEKNAVDTVIDYIDAVNILSSLAGPTQSTTPTGKQQASGTQVSKKTQQTNQSMLEKMRGTLDKDRKRTPISNVILRCTEPPDVNVVVTLRTANLRDLTLSELHKNNVRVVGKVTRIVEEGQSMSTFENYGMSLLKPDVLKQMFDGLADSKDVVAKFSEVQIKGPAVQILPLMIFV